MNKIKIDNYYKPESKTLRLDEVDYTIKPSFTTRKLKQLQQENQKLKERIEYLERSNNRREDTILEQRQEISDLEDNWNKLKKDIDYELLKLREPNEYNNGLINAFTYINNKIQEIIGGEIK